MFKNVKLGTKIILGFLAVVALVGVAGVTGYWGVETVGKALHTVAEKEYPIADASMGMILAIVEGEMAGDKLKSATAVMATADAAQLDRIVKTFNETILTFDAFANAILKGGEIDGKIIIETDNEELASNIREIDQLHNNKFQPAFESLQESGRKLLASKANSNKAMDTVKSKFDDLVKMAEVFELDVAEEVAKNMAVADTAEKIKDVMAKQIPLADCSMEIKFAVAQSRLALEWIAQSQSEEEVNSD